MHNSLRTPSDTGVLVHEIFSVCIRICLRTPSDTGVLVHPEKPWITLPCLRTPSDTGVLVLALIGDNGIIVS